MSKSINKSLYVPRINKSFNADKIINIFWLFNVGKVDRVDFMPIIDPETGIEDTKFQKAFIYMSDICNAWNFEQLKYNETEGSYTLFPYRVPYKKYPNNININNTERDNDNDVMSLKNNPKPIPYADTTLNVHQLYHNNLQLEEKIIGLEREILELKNENM